MTGMPKKVLGQQLSTRSAEGPQLKAAARTSKSYRLEVDGLTSRFAEIADQINANDTALIGAEKAAGPRVGFANYTEPLTNNANRPIFFKTLW